MTISAPIFAVGNLDRAQAALRSDGQWFIRTRGLHGYWGRWSTTPKRPDAAWYNPRLGRARLPEPELEETI
jgi:hypothetical protein